MKAVALSHRLSHRLEEVRARAWHMHAYYLAAVACGSGGLEERVDSVCG